MELPEESMEATPPFIEMLPAVIEPRLAEMADRVETLIKPEVIVLAAILLPTIVVAAICVVVIVPDCI